ncbi:sensor histidine kinase [Noviherbaspirillum galbum]|uniref:histidine kinase n=1 Tax=Noviherbaspirillum galbum TaxID=2709383 RepID=A0A6B3SJI4_9BURK|nr:HAMP domain-containing sensor histidine kinase [Noviherbaspirillum galbum]NEX61014.1 HAMP domain-containing histidine kinase [Noviherbaspirillum galbum]
MRLSQFLVECGDRVLSDPEVLNMTGPLSGRRRAALLETIGDVSASMEGRSPENAGAATEFGALSLSEGSDIARVTRAFQALRQRSIALWQLVQQAHPLPQDALDQVCRFNAALDHAMCESLNRFANGAERVKNLHLSILGHDLRTPLGALAITNQYLARPDIPEHKRVEAIARLERCVGAMNAMVKDVLDYSRTRLGKPIIMQLQSADLALLCQHVAEDVRAAYPDIDLRCDPMPDLVLVCDPSRVHHALSNLIVNAIEHGNRRLPIHLGATLTEERAVVQIRHTGRAIPPHSLERLFDPFVQPDAPEDKHDEGGYASMGLRLNVARAIVRSHGGDVTASSEAGGETVFSLALPR